jgi:hypothetical protein
MTKEFSLRSLADLMRRFRMATNATMAVAGSFGSSAAVAKPPAVERHSATIAMG